MLFPNLFLTYDNPDESLKELPVPELDPNID